MNTELYLDLLGKKALEGLTEQEQEQLDEMILTSGNVDESFDQAAAVISMVDLKTNEPLPAHLQAKILEDAEKIFQTDKTPVRQVSYEQPKPSFWNLNWLGWAAAAAACIALVVNVWLTRFPPPGPTMAEQRQKMINAGGDMIMAKWAVGNDNDI